MRLSRVKLSGFKSFVDPTSVPFPSNLTGVVGPNGCGKSNIIDAVRWVMGELSARHLRGDSMADVIFNGSGGRRPVGSASVELLFDNSDGKIGGSYANYNEISLRRLVSRDGSSNYFINGARCRRKDITTLFLGTGLGSRSYAIIEQGMISRVIEARSDDMRAFVEEAAGISRYKERRRETESRMADTRENLERLQDVRDEVDKQIRHLTRQASQARRYQELRNTEQRLTAELLALRLRDIDTGAALNDRSMRDSDLSLQRTLAELRHAEAAVEKQREFQFTASERLGSVQAGFYQQAAEVARVEQSLLHGRELRERRRAELAQVKERLDTVRVQLERDEVLGRQLKLDLDQLLPGLEQAQSQEASQVQLSDAAEANLSQWQQRWEDFNRQAGTTFQTIQVERTRIEQIDELLKRLATQLDRLAVDQDQWARQDASGQLQSLAENERAARESHEAINQTLRTRLTGLQHSRLQQQELERELDQARGLRDQVRSELVSLEAMQRASLGETDRDAGKWLEAAGLSQRPRVAAQLEVERGWERGVEIVLGEILEAVEVDSLDSHVDRVAELTSGQVMLVEAGEGSAASEQSLARRVRAPAAILRRLSRVTTVASLREALAQRRGLSAGETLVTPEGYWVGRDWLKIARGREAHTGVIEREHRIRALRATLKERDTNLAQLDQRLQSLRTEWMGLERGRDELQEQMRNLQMGHSESRSSLETARVRSEQAAQRLARIANEREEIVRERALAEGNLSRSRQALDEATSAWAELEAQREQLEAERDELRGSAQSARSLAMGAQTRVRDLLVQLEGRRSAESSMRTATERMREQQTELEVRQQGLEVELVGDNAPLEQLSEQLNELLTKRLEVESELQAARRDLEGVDAQLKVLDEHRLTAEQRVVVARAALEQSRLAAQESRLRRESLQEQFAQTRFDLDEVLAALPADAHGAEREDLLVAAQTEVQKLGQVNLAAIDELKENSERKIYLDAQWQDLTDALSALTQAMQKIDRETRSRFEATFERINEGLKEKFPRLFGGGSAYLELVGDDALNAGVAVMARPPGKRNSTISQLSGGEKALTAVALVFSIFDLNPAPFCLLDEVDAPLDEHNVSRFCDIVREMSSRVQFIFITHNKTTMELASQLIGVTMNEPGVSRLVTVDVDEAVRLVAV